jgi:hypothetical protein
MLCIGQSHMVCVLLAAEEAGEPLEAIALKDVRWFGELKRTGLSVESLKSLDREALAKREDPVFSFIGGMYHTKLGLYRHPQPFDFVLPEAPDLPLEADAELIPSEAMRKVVQQAVRRHLHLLRKIAAIAGGPVYHFESPPPPAESWLTAKRIEKAIMQKKLGPLAGRFLRYKLWRLHSEIVRERAEEIGTRFVGHPQAAIDDEGFLRPEFCRNPTHANERYGALILEQMKALA